MRKTLYYVVLIAILAFLIALPNAFAVVKSFRYDSTNGSTAMICGDISCYDTSYGTSILAQATSLTGASDYMYRFFMNWNHTYASIPQFAVINSVTLEVQSGSLTEGEVISIYPMKTVWNPSTLTYNTLSNADTHVGIACTNSGGGQNITDYNGSWTLGSFELTSTETKYNITIDPQWYQDCFEGDGEYCNGWMGRLGNDVECQVYTRNRIYTEDYTTVNHRPALYVDYSPGTAPANFSFAPPTPPNATKNNTQIQINATCAEGNAILYLDSSSTPTTQVANGSDHVLYSTNFNSSGWYYYRGSCNSGALLSPVEQYFYDGFQPSITLNGGNAFTVDNVTVDRYADLQSFNITLEDETDLFGFLFNISLGGATIYSYQNETLSGTLFNWTQTINVSSYTTSVYSVDVWASDSHTKEEICPYNDQDCYNAKKKASELEFDTPEGVNVRVVTKENSTVNTEKLRDRQTFEFTWTDGKVKKRTFDLYSSHGLWYVGWRTQIPGHFVILGDNGIEGNWIDFAGTGITYSDVSVKKITDFHYEVTLEKSVDYAKFESIGGLNVNHENYALIIADLTSDVNVIPAQPTKFSNLQGQCIGNETGGDDVQFEWTWYNGTSVFNQSFFNDSINYTQAVFATLNTIQSSTLSVGDNWTFSCHARSFGVESDWKNFSVGTVLDTLVGNCSNGLIYPVLNMSYFDEVSGQSITADNGVAFFFDDGQLVRNFTANFAGNSHDAICTNLNPAILPYEWDVWGDILALEKDGYATRTFNIPQSEAITVNNTDPYSLELQLIPLNQSTTLQYTWLTSAYQPIDGTMRVFRCNIDATETLTDSLPIIQGSVAANIELINTLYRYEVIIDGVTYDDPTGFGLCHTETLTERTFFVEVNPLDIDQKLGMYDITCRVRQVSPNIVQMNWTTNPQSSLPITGCLEAYRASFGSWTKTYENCTSTAFTITRTIPNNGNDYQVRGRLYQSGFSVGCNEIVTVEADKAGLLFGATSLLSVVFLIIALSLIWSGKDQGSLVGAGIAVVISWVLGIINLPWITVSAVITFLMIIAYIARSNTRQ